MSTLHVRGSEGLNSLFAHTVTEMSNNSASLSRPALFQRAPKHFSTFCIGIFCNQTGVFVGRMHVHQQSRVTVASDSLVHWRESIFGAKVNMSPSLHQHPDGLTSTGFTLHSKGQGCFCQKNKYITHLFLKTTASDQDQWNVPFYGYWGDLFRYWVGTMFLESRDNVLKGNDGSSSKNLLRNYCKTKATPVKSPESEAQH